jgi:SAM-dependent methyltransferase
VTTVPDTSSWSGGETIRVDACPACGASQRVLHASSVFDHLDPKVPDRWQVWRCHSCESLYPDPRPSNESLSAAYARYYTHAIDPETGGQQGLRGRAAAYVNDYLNHRFRVHLEPSLAPGFAALSLVEPFRLQLDYFGAHLFLAGRGGRRRVLDVGCGNGAFLRRAVSLGWEASGLDPDPSAVQAARSLGMDVHEGFIDSSAIPMAAEFDAIVFRHSIEHVVDIRANLRCALGRLKPGGMIWLAWPNPTGPGATYLREAWRGLEVPRHLCIPSRKAMTRLLVEAGFERPAARRRGRHAREIMRESAAIALAHGDATNLARASRSRWIRRWSDLIATLVPGAGEELVMVAYAPSVTSGVAP